MRAGRFKAVGGLIAVFLLTFGAGALVGKYLEIGVFRPSIEEKAERGKPVNILFMGVDARITGEKARSDTMILASIDKKEHRVALVWIPRDTRVEVRGHNQKINGINATDGPEAAAAAVGKLLGTRVHHYTLTNFDGFVRIIDILGGVTIDVEPDMKHADPDPKLRINLPPGVQRLNGADALGYVRYRGGPTADIGRTQRQQKFIKALAQEMLKPANILKLPQLIPEIARNVDTNIPISDMGYMVKAAREFSAGNIVTQTLPGYSFTDPATGASYWEADADIARGIVDKLLAGQKFDVAQDPPARVKQRYVVTPVQEIEEATEGGEGLEETGEGTIPAENIGEEGTPLPDGTVPPTGATGDSPPSPPTLPGLQVSDQEPETGGLEQNPSLVEPGTESDPPISTPPFGESPPVPGTGSEGY